MAENATTGTEADAVQNDVLMVGSVEKAFRILSAFTNGKTSFSLTEFTSAVGMNKSAVQRFTHTLEKLGYLIKDPSTKRYQLSVRTLELAAAYVSSNTLINRVTPYLMHLSKSTDETVSLSVLDGDSIVFVSRFLSRNVLHTDVVNGKRLPAYCTAPGIAMLSALPRADAIAILKASRREKFTPATVTEMDALAAELDTAASRGFASAVSQIYMGDISVASPILDQENRPIGAINLAVPEARYNPEEAIAKFGPLVAATARSSSLNI